MRTVIRDDVEWSVKEYDIAGYDFWTDWELNGWEQYTLEVVDQFAQLGTTVIDVGAFVGPISMWASDCDADVVAIEPDPVALSHLRINCANNTPDVMIIPGAITSHTGECNIMPHPDGWGSSMTRVGNHGTTVPCWTLPDLFDVLELDNVSLVKIDTEGSESLFLSEVAPFLANLKIPMLCAMHEDWWSEPLQREWFDGYSEVIGHMGGFDQILCLP